MTPAALGGAPYSGGCVCGATRYRLTAEPLTLYACHCTDCQKRSGSAFGLSMWVPRGAIEITQGEPAALASRLGVGRAWRTRACAQCATRLWSEPGKYPEFAVMRPGTLDDTSWLVPVAHIWTRSAQPWYAFPEGVARHETQPADMRELMSLWRARGTTGRPDA